MRFLSLRAGPLGWLLDAPGIAGRLVCPPWQSLWLPRSPAGRLLA